ncbi:hypothetical protein AK812_SmicGene12889 [Symbiodinium microadriaticum]|uniref:Uncharacterized protein n=1 Tax=Symbiodinium microadriaticum TaxID=2951 RepID=A0A1Q9E9K2_SYMMI|nr:hypothetical protein AK812_SmicGene12889 [Symbiodinium microadriaticum]
MAGGDLDVTQLMTAREVMDHVLACAAVHLSWLEALPQAYLFNVEDGAHTDANAIDELLATQIPLEVENQEVEVGLLPVALDGAGPQNALESALARFPVVTSEEREAKAYKVLCHYFEAGAEMGTDARTPMGERSSDCHQRQRPGQTGTVHVLAGEWPLQQWQLLPICARGSRCLAGGRMVVMQAIRSAGAGAFAGPSLRTHSLHRKLIRCSGEECRHLRPLPGRGDSKTADARDAACSTCRGSLRLLPIAEFAECRAVPQSFCFVLRIVDDLYLRASSVGDSLEFSRSSVGYAVCEEGKLQEASIGSPPSRGGQDTSVTAVSVDSSQLKAFTSAVQSAPGLGQDLQKELLELLGGLPGSASRARMATPATDVHAQLGPLFVPPWAERLQRGAASSVGRKLEAMIHPPAMGGKTAWGVNKETVHHGTDDPEELRKLREAQGSFNSREEERLQRLKAMDRDADSILEARRARKSSFDPMAVQKRGDVDAFRKQQEEALLRMAEMKEQKRLEKKQKKLAEKGEKPKKEKKVKKKKGKKDKKKKDKKKKKEKKKKGKKRKKSSSSSSDSSDSSADSSDSSSSSS